MDRTAFPHSTKLNAPKMDVREKACHRPSSAIRWNDIARHRTWHRRLHLALKMGVKKLLLSSFEKEAQPWFARQRHLDKLLLLLLPPAEPQKGRLCFFFFISSRLYCCNTLYWGIGRHHIRRWRTYMKRRRWAFNFFFPLFFFLSSNQADRRCWNSPAHRWQDNFCLEDRIRDSIAYICVCVTLVLRSSFVFTRLICAW